MTREEAIEVIKAYRDNLTDSASNQLDGDIEAFDIVIKALEQEPCDVFDEYGNYKYPSDVELTEPNTATSMPCEDVISRQAVQDYIAKYLSQYLYNDVREAVEVIDEYIGELPPVNPQPKIGNWIFVDKANEHAHCSECDYGNVDLLDGRPHNYCPNCGAKMSEIPTGSESEDKE